MSTTVEVDGLQLHYVRTPVPAAPGTPAAPPIVLVPGLGFPVQQMVPLMDQLAGREVVVVDVPGVGGSDDPRRLPTVPELADMLAHFVSAIGIDRAVYIGNSLGAQVAAELACRHPERVVGAVLVGPTPDPSISSTLRQALRLLRDIPHERPALVWLAIVSYLRAGPLQMWRILRRSMQRGEAAMPGITVPVLIVRGEHDPLVRQPGVEEINRLVPGSRLLVIPGAGHAPNFSDPEALMATMRPFLAELDAAELDLAQDSGG